jgi:uncharacterized damage-inducible protein DinB
LTYVNFFKAHKNPVFKICLNLNGDMLASCSRSNGSIKIFKIPSGEKLFKFKRTYTSNTITGMNFNILESNKLVVSSSSSNLHIFDLEKTNKAPNQQDNLKNEGYLDQINKIYQKVAKECKEYLNNKNLTTTVNIKDLKGDNILLFREDKEQDNKKKPAPKINKKDLAAVKAEEDRIATELKEKEEKEKAFQDFLSKMSEEEQFYYLKEMPTKEPWLSWPEGKSISTIKKAGEKFVELEEDINTEKGAILELQFIPPPDEDPKKKAKT